ncbi:MAG: type II/IV secretion system protein [Planctomycetia bacterium]|nr:type II/IV secretion system protein [Planctomycetia bacterium]
MAKARGDFTEILLKKGILSADQLQEARGVVSQTGAKINEALIKLGYARAEEIISAIAEQSGIPYVTLTDVTIPPTVIQLVPESVARENNIVPLSYDDGLLKIVMSDPSDLGLMQKLEFILNKQLTPAIAPKEQIVEAINRHYGQNETDSVDAMLQDIADGIESGNLKDLGNIEEEDDDAPIIKLCNLIIQEAVSLRASDIHIEPFAERIRIRYRIDGVLVERESPPRRLLAPILSRLKIMGSIDISEKRRPQDGRIKLNLQGNHYDLRVSMLPTTNGQSCVMRILDRSNIKVSIKDLGFSSEDYNRFQQIIKRPNGIFLVTGPTGSGKTTTLYAALNEMNKPDRKIITAEDPVEYYLPGINQVEVKHNIGLDFARIIRAMLRQAPNIILVGEIRDHETAEIAIQASLTGHLVFSTLHTNDAPSAITRLIDIGVQPFLVASSVIAIMAQRLVRIVCPKCKGPAMPPPDELKASGLSAERIKAATFTKGRGCNNCNHGGYRGRRGIFEMLKMTSALRESTFKREPAQSLRRQARANGMRTLLEDGLAKACNGLTTLDEVLSSCHHEHE